MRHGGIIRGKGKTALFIVFVIILSIFFVSLMKTSPPVTTVSAESSLTLRASPKATNVNIIDPNDPTLSARRNGYAVYNLTVNSTVDVSYIDFEATNSSDWAVKFLNLSGVPLNDSNGNDKPDIEDVLANIDYYVYARVKVPASTSNGTSLTQTIYANASDGSTSSVDVKTTCELFGVEAVPAGPTEPHAIMGTVKYENGTHADDAFVLLINTETGETSWDTVGEKGVSGVSGNYSTDASQFPKGFSNGTVFKLIANDGKYYGVDTIKADNTTPCQYLNITLNILFSELSKAVENLTGTKDGDNITLQWDAAKSAAKYRIYRSENLTGYFNFSNVHKEVSANSYTDVDAFLDNKNYSYVVRSVNDADEENKTCSNIAFKLCEKILYDPAGTGTSINWISLPYHNEYSILSDVANDLDSQLGKANIDAVTVWNEINLFM